MLSRIFNKTSKPLSDFPSQEGSTTTNPNDHGLCTRCASLDLIQILGNPVPLNFAKVIWILGSTESQWRMAGCNLCTFLAAAFPEPKPDMHFTRCFVAVNSLTSFKHGDAHPAYVILIMAFAKPGVLGESEFISISSLLTQPDPLAHFVPGMNPIWRGGFTFSTTPVFLGTLESRSTCNLPRVCPGSIDLEMVKDWIEHCKRFHNCEHHPRHRVNPLNILLIDCESRQVVHSDTNSPFVALSYVWGGTEFPVETEMKLPDNLPNTIRDSINVTKRLGWKYLWIDRYCIPQHDKNAMHNMICQMDRIYGLAELTMIAAAGSDPHHGLPGVGTTIRTPQPTLRLSGHTLASTTLTGKPVIENTTWNSRGWTYQEAVCSVRRLFFTEHQLLYECEEAQLESIPCETVKPVFGQLPKRNSFSIAQGTRDLVKRISEYSKRKLSYDSDALNGMMGIFRVYGMANPPLKQYWGIVYSHRLPWALPWGSMSELPDSALASFLVGLFWEPESPGRRRTNFPSWSWTGWTCPVKSQLRILNYHVSSYTILFAGVWVPTACGKEWVDFDEFQDRWQPSQLGHGLSRSLKIHSLTIDLSFKKMGSDQWSLQIAGSSKTWTDSFLPLEMDQNAGIGRSNSSKSHGLKGVVIGFLPHPWSRAYILVLRQAADNKHDGPVFERIGSLHTVTGTDEIIRAASRETLIVT